MMRESDFHQVIWGASAINVDCCEIDFYKKSAALQVGDKHKVASAAAAAPATVAKDEPTATKLEQETASSPPQPMGKCC